MGLYDDDPETRPPAETRGGTCELVEFGWGVRFEHPPAWLRRERAGAVMVVPVEGALENFSVFTAPLERVPTIEEHAAASLAGLRRRLPGCNIVDKRALTVGGVDAYQVVFVADDGGRRVKGRQIWLLNGNLAVTLAYLAREGSYEEYAVAVDAMVASVRLVSPAR